MNEEITSFEETPEYIKEAIETEFRCIVQEFLATRNVPTEAVPAHELRRGIVIGEDLVLILQQELDFMTALEDDDELFREIDFYSNPDTQDDEYEEYD